MKKPLSERLNFRIDEESFSVFEGKVKASGRSKSEFFRELVLTNKTQVIERKKTTDNTKQALYLLNKSSNNINQLARAANIANQTGKLSDSLYASFLSELENKSQLLKALLDHVS
ncbi:plasmid mobilization protein [Methylobacter luteus]|uniref:plasmid mobilization protein n=1 Tax=Methylobacter luteus TaxID=415 RepID=UPI0004289FE3|nr:plasmid mobilization relaxosome protein MobC [Methylobacter luteus]